MTTTGRAPIDVIELTSLVINELGAAMAAGAEFSARDITTNLRAINPDVEIEHAEVSRIVRFTMTSKNLPYPYKGEAASTDDGQSYMLYKRIEIAAPEPVDQTLGDLIAEDEEDDEDEEDGGGCSDCTGCE